MIRKAANTELAISVAWPMKAGNAEGIVGFVCEDKEKSDENLIISYCKQFLPEYMIPKKIHFIEQMPLNINGKINRGKLFEMLEAGEVK